MAIETIQLEWINVETDTPDHKTLVLCDIGIGVPVPAIYFSNQSFKGFWKFTTFYHSYNPSPYKKTKLKPQHKIEGVIRWVCIEELIK